jgi:hypothetical protein
VGTTGPMGSGLPQFGFPRRFAICFCVLRCDLLPVHPPRTVYTVGSEGKLLSYFTDNFFKNQ